MTILDHLEAYLGPIETGWSPEAFAREAKGLTVARLAGKLGESKAFATVGLSSHVLTSRASEKRIRQELVFIAQASFGDRNIPALLEQVAQEAVRSHSAYLRGDVIGPRGRLFDAGEMTALYVAIPVYLPNAFASFERDDGETTIVAWLFPITDDEARFVATHGWSAFEDQLEAHDPDLTDPLRESLPLGRRDDP